ncbi:hypothetical protein [Stutzerimonas azotifigens]|uniref:hypothetical protein n=1 Tax=Stutzerimonas azotifigens TaxID=291995 RepID=UPI0003F6A0F2|nr:hypothetical protein [Stutzerimonas azotifigens]
MKLALAFALPLALAALPAAAKSCYVTAATSGAVPPPVIKEQCFEFTGLDNGDALDWACRNNTEEVLNERRETRASCPGGYFATCTGRMTPESLTSARATGSQGDPQLFEGTIPEDAKIVNYYYEATDHAQAKIDCESGGGTWGQ